MGRISVVVKYCLDCRFQSRFLTNSASGVGIPIESREVAAGYLQSDSMASLEHIAGGPKVDRIFVDFVGLNKLCLGSRFSIPGPDNAIGEINCTATWTNVQKLAGEIRIHDRRRSPEGYDDRPGNFHIFFQHWARVDQNIGSAFDFSMVEGARRYRRLIATQSSTPWWVPGFWGYIEKHLMARRRVRPDSGSRIR